MNMLYIFWFCAYNFAHYVDGFVQLQVLGQL